MLAISAGCLTLVAATVAWSVPVARDVRDWVCGTGDAGCSAPLYQVSDLGRCRVISRADRVAEDAVAFSDGVLGTEHLRLSRSVDKNAVVTWRVERDDERPGLVVIRTFADRRSADRFTLAVARHPGRQAVRTGDGSGLAGWFADRIDGPGPQTAPAPSAFVVTSDGAAPSTSGSKTFDPPALPGPGPTGDAVARTWYADPDDPSRLNRLRTVWELDWGAAQELTLASPTGNGRLLLALTQTRDGVPLDIDVEAAGDLAARLSPPTSGEAFVDPLSRPVGDLSVPVGTHVGRLVLSVNLQDSSTREFAQALTARLGAPLFDASVELDDSGRRARAAALARARRQVEYASLTGLLAAADHGLPGTSVTLHEPGLPGAGPAEVATTPTGRLTFTGAVPAADYYLAASAGFVKWQECTPVSETT